MNKPTIRKYFHHPIGENMDTFRITIGDNCVDHSWDFYVHPNFSIEIVRQIIEDALIKANRVEDQKP